MNNQPQKKKWYQEKKVTFRELSVCMLITGMIALAVIGFNELFLVK